MVTSHTWVDTPLCHALGGAFEVDIFILMGDNDLLVGVSSFLSGSNDA